MAQSYHYQVRSEKFEGKGFPARQIVTYLKESKLRMQFEVPISQYVPELVKKLDMTARKAKIYGNSEHTLYIMATNKRRNKFGYLALPIMIRGLKDKEVTFD
jgi:hypothetical protein